MDFISQFGGYVHVEYVAGRFIGLPWGKMCKFSRFVEHFDEFSHAYLSCGLVICRSVDWLILSNLDYFAT